MKDFITVFRIAKRNKWILVYNYYCKMYDCMTTEAGIYDRPHIDVVKDFRFNK